MENKANTPEQLFKSIQINANASRAKEVFLHYYALSAKKAGLPINNDNIAELYGIIDDIIYAAVVETLKEFMRQWNYCKRNDVNNTSRVGGSE